MTSPAVCTVSELSPATRPAPASPLALEPLRVLFAGGGTGGHLYPAIAAARGVQALAPGSEVLFVGSERPLEKKILAPTGFRHVALPTAPWRGARGALRFAWEQARGLLAARALIREFAPDVVLGLGGFPSVAPVVAGWWAGVPVALFEPNAVPGRANVLLARLAREAYVHWEATALSCRRVPSGTPIGPRALARGVTRDEARSRLRLPADGPVVLVMGGSQGARPINAWIAAQAEALEGSGVAFLHLAGNGDAADDVAAAYAAARVPHRVLDFLPEIGLAYRAADVAIVRGGGATLAELTAVGLPAVVVPLPSAVGDHQRLNAEAYAASGAGEWVAQDELNQETLQRVVALARNEERRAALRVRALEGARPEAAVAMARRLAALAGRAVEV